MKRYLEKPLNSVFYRYNYGSMLGNQPNGDFCKLFKSIYRFIIIGLCFCMCRNIPLSSVLCSRARVSVKGDVCGNA